MKLQLSPKDYRMLINTLQLANLVLNSFREDNSPETAEFVDFEQRVLSLAKEMGYDEMVTLDNETGMYYPAWDLTDSEFAPMLQQFEEDLFWLKLEENLSYRDLVMQEGEETINNLDQDTFLRMMDEKKDFYMQEFDEHGLNRIVIDEWATKNQTRH